MLAMYKMKWTCSWHIAICRYQPLNLLSPRPIAQSRLGTPRYKMNSIGVIQNLQVSLNFQSSFSFMFYYAHFVVTVTAALEDEGV